jgi:cell division protein FtsB
LKRRALQILFWFIAVSLGFNALFGDMGLVHGIRQRRLASRLQREVASLQRDNDALMAEVKALRRDPSRIETIAREDLGLTRPGEIIFLFKDPDAPKR